MVGGSPRLLGRALNAWDANTHWGTAMCHRVVRVIIVVEIHVDRFRGGRRREWRADDLFDRLVGRGDRFAAKLHVGHGPEVGRAEIECRDQHQRDQHQHDHPDDQRGAALRRRCLQAHGVILRPEMFGSLTVVMKTWRWNASLKGPSVVPAPSA